MDQKPARKKRGIVQYMIFGCAGFIGVLVLFYIVMALVPGLIIMRRNSNASQQVAGAQLLPLPYKDEVRPWLESDQLAARMPQHQEFYRRLRDETWAEFQRLHPGTHPYDENARKIIGTLTYLCIWGDYYGENLFRDIHSLYVDSNKEGLADPLFEVILDLDLFTGYSHSHEARMCVEVKNRSESLDATAYPAAFKFWAATNAARNLMNCQQSHVPNIEQYMPLLPPLAGQILKHYEVMLNEKYPPNYLFTRADGWMSNLQNDVTLLEQAGQKMDELWSHSDPDSPTRLILKGAYEVNMAWALRTSGWASQVTEKGRSGMQLHLSKAREILEGAYERYPGEWPICGVMMNVVLGGDGDRAEMEKWFQRGVQASSNWGGIYSCKAHYLLPRWYGSKKEEVSFTQECLAGGRFDIKAPLVLINNLQYYPDDFGDDFPQQNWSLLQTIFEGFLQKYPRSDYYRTLYLKFAMKAKQEKIAAEQFRLLGDYWDSDAISGEAYQEIFRKFDTNP
ncbi:MAG: hypothetical protein B9S32_10085 [Verrucomicrobia bacterium Tous-C9LFEB]|nr:MAG: hypothetical protein B9S32_10085 [Verrucomicrobia bacterium Tous-C9LFEB]